MKLISYEKMSKKKKREINNNKRGSWNGINPVTRIKESKKVYNRKKIQNQSFNEDDGSVF